MNKINVLDKGYVRLVDVLGNDLSIVNAARVSYDKESEEFTEKYNELTNLPIKIGEEGFIQKFKDLSQEVLDNNESFFDVIQRIKDYMLKNILGEQSLT